MTDAARLRLFGDFALEDGSGRPIALHLRKAEALLAYLATAPGQSATREKLATLLWSDSDQQRARQSLRQVLFALSKAFAQHELPLLHLESQSVRLGEGAFSVDAVELRRLLVQGTEESLRAGCDLYDGEFLSGFNVGAPEFEDWLAATRNLYREAVMQALTELLREQEQSGRLEPAIDTALRALRIEPFREDIHRRLMGIYAARGMRSSALGQYRRCRDILQRDLGVRPDEETTRLHRRIVEQRGEGGPPDGGPLDGRAAVGEAAHLADRIARLAAASDGLSIGREEELKRLRDLMKEASDGGARMALVSGEFGIGKSHLLNAIACDLAVDGTLVLLGRGHRADGALDFDLWSEALAELPPRRADRSSENSGRASENSGRASENSDRVADLLGRLARSMRPGDPSALDLDPREAYGEVVRELRELAGDKGLAVVLDDLDRADDASLKLLRFVVRNLRRAPVLVVGAAGTRALERAPLLRGILRDLESDELLVSIVLEPLSREQSLELAWQLQQVLEVKRDTKARLNRFWRLSEGNPWVVREAILGGAARGDAPQGGEMPLPAVVLDEVESRTSRLGGAARRLLRAAAAIGRRSSYEVAARAAALSGARAAEAAEELVAEELVALEGDEIVFVQRRVALAVYEDLLAPRRKLLHAAVARAMEEVHAAAPEPLYQAIAGHWQKAGDGPKALPFELEAARVEIDRGSPASARRLFQQTVESASRMEGDETAARAEIDARLELVALAGIEEKEDEGDRTAASLDVAEALARRHDWPRRMAAIRFARARLHWIRGEEERAYEATRRALAETVASEAPGFRLASERLIVRLHLAGGDGKHARDRMERRRARSASLGLRRDAADATAVLGLLQAIGGNFEEAVRRCDQAIEMAETVVDESYMVACLQARAIVDCWRGLGGSALARFDEALESVRARGDLPRRCALTGLRGYAMLIDGRPEPAAASLKEALAMGRRMNSRLFAALFKAWLAECSVDLVSEEDALRLSREAFTEAGEGNQAWARSIALRALARVLARPGYRDLHGAHGAIRQAIAIQDGLGLRCEMARSLVVQAKILRARGNARRSSEIFGEAGEMFARMGLAAEFDRARTMAEALRPAP